jgi:peptidoglycan/LPS O-acetylase OafA/YrhL
MLMSHRDITCTNGAGLEIKLETLVNSVAICNSDLAAQKTHPVRKHIGALTGLCFFAALYVFVFHFGSGLAERSGVPAQIVIFLSNGYLGVSIVFVLSGFILTYTYRQRVDSPQAFALARFARRYPVYFLALSIALPLALRQPKKYWMCLSMVQSWTPFSFAIGLRMHHAGMDRIR